MSIKEKIGIVVSDKMKKTRIVLISDKVKHKRYGKIISRTKRYPVHDPDSISKIGDKVCIRETRPISKTVNWILTTVYKN